MSVFKTRVVDAVTLFSACPALLSLFVGGRIGQIVFDTGNVAINAANLMRAIRLGRASRFEKFVKGVTGDEAIESRCNQVHRQYSRLHVSVFGVQYRA